MDSGIEYQKLSYKSLSSWAHIHIFRLDLQKYTLSVIRALDLPKNFVDISNYVKFSKGLLAVNGGFFDHRYKSLGLRISNYQQLSPLKKISWWGILYIKDNIPYLSSYQDFYYKKNIDFAIQAGPRLLIDGKIPSLLPGVAERSALGITHDKKLIILITDSLPLSTSKLAEIMKASPLNCVQALNLDGGSSSQLYAQIGSFRLYVPAFAYVSDVIVVHKK